MAKKSTASIIKTWTSIKKEVKGLTKSKSPVQDAQKILKKFVTQAEKDFKSAVEKDIPKLITRFKKERKDLEKSVEKVVKTEIKKAQKFLKEYKKELEKVNIQVRVTLPSMPKKKKVTKKKTKAKKKTTTRKKATKASPAKKKVTKRKTAKKSTKKKA